MVPVDAVWNVPPDTFISFPCAELVVPALLKVFAAISAPPFKLSVPPLSTIVLPAPSCLKVPETVVVPPEAVLNSPFETVRLE